MNCFFSFFLVVVVGIVIDIVVSSSTHHLAKAPVPPYRPVDNGAGIAECNFREYFQTVNQKLPCIYDFIDFRRYFEEYRIVRSAIDPKFTHYFICHQLGMKNSRGYFNNITSGRKNMSATTIPKIIDLFRLSLQEADYLRALVNYGQTRQPDEKRYYFDQIIRLNATPRKIIDEQTYSYFTTWYHPVLRELLATLDFSDNFRELANKIDPPLTVKQVKESIALLLDLDLIKKNEDGFYKPNGKIISTPENLQNELIEQYQLLSFEKARESIINKKFGHKTTTMTIAVSQEGLKQLLDNISQARSSFRSVAQKDDHPNKKVYEIILHMHAHTR